MAGPVIVDVLFNGYFKSQTVAIGKNGYLVGDKFDPHSTLKVRFTGLGGEAFTIQNVATGLYLAPQGDHIVANSPVRYIWYIVPKAVPLPGYYFETTDRQRAWFLPSGIDGTPIVLKPVNEIHGTEDEEKAEWVWREV